MYETHKIPYRMLSSDNFSRFSYAILLWLTVADPDKKISGGILDERGQF